MEEKKNWEGLMLKILQLILLGCIIIIHKNSFDAFFLALAAFIFGVSIGLEKKEKEEKEEEAEE